MKFCPYCGCPEDLCDCSSGQDRNYSPRPSKETPQIDDKDYIDKKTNASWDKYKPKPQHPHQKKCKDNLCDLIASAANIENALANAINAESSIIKGGKITPDQSVVLMNKLENLLKLAIKKEIILGLLIEDATNACIESKKWKY